MHPSVPDPGAAGEPQWPPRGTPGSDQPPPGGAETDAVEDQEQRTTALPRRPDAGRFPYPPPPGHDPIAEPTAEPPPPPRYQQPPRGSHLPPYQEPFAGAGPAAAAPYGAAPYGPGAAPYGPAMAAQGPEPAPSAAGPPTAPRTGPRKLTVTRVAAFRSRELTTRGVQIFQRAATADGADRSGMTALTYAVMGNYAVDAALAVALANTLFFAAATAESTSKVLLYLLITVAPFAVIAPLIGPALDKLQHGRRIALGASSFARAVLAIVMALNFDSWVLYPCALGMLVLSKSFSVLKAAITPRVLPPELSLVKSNSRQTVFGLLAGGAAGAVAAGLSWAFGSTGALIFTALLSIGGGWLCLRIPAWVESTAGEIPVDGVGPKAKHAFPLSVTTTLWANGSIRVETGFLALFIAFVIKSEYSESNGFTQLLLLGVVGLAAGLGGFIGNGLGARLPLSKPETVSILSLAAVAVTTLVAVLAPGLASAAIVGLVGSTASSLAKVCLDSVIQHELPEASRASAFGLSETVLQLSWVFGGVVGLLIGGVWSFGHDSVYSIGFAVITVLLIIGLAQSWLVRSGRSLFPWLDYSRLSKHFRRSDKRDKSGGGKLGGFGRKSAARDAAAPPPAPTTPWQEPPTSAQAWSNQQPPAQYPRPTQYGPPAAYQQPPYHQQGPYPQPPYQQPYQQPYQPPAPYAQPYPPGYQQPAAPTTAQPSGPPAAQPDHPPARDAGAKRKWTKRS